MTKHTTQDRCIRNIVEQGPMAALYFFIAIDEAAQ